MQTVLPALAAGMTVVCDRFADSTMAYQGFGQGADRAMIAGLTRLLPRLPDVTVVLAVDPEVGAARIGARRQPLDHYESLGPAFHARVAAGYAAIAAAEPGRCRVVDANGDADAVHAAILRVLG